MFREAKNYTCTGSKVRHQENTLNSGGKNITVCVTEDDSYIVEDGVGRHSKGFGVTIYTPFYNNLLGRNAEKKEILKRGLPTLEEAMKFMSEQDY